MSLRERPGLGIIEPCLPSPAKAPRTGPGWLHEIKHDGFHAFWRGGTLPVCAADYARREQTGSLYRNGAGQAPGSLVLNRRRGNCL
jgi:hypothetical protein